MSDRIRFGHPKGRNGAALRLAKHARGWLRAILALCALTMLVACERDAEQTLRTKLDHWFYLGETVYFQSRSRCTGAMIRLESAYLRPTIAVQTNYDRAKETLRANGVAAIRKADMTPTELTDAMLMSGNGDFGKQALAAGALAASCFNGTEMGALLFDALHTPGATLVYDTQSSGLMVVDPGLSSLFYVAGDVW
ncbi:hypothetical protein EOK75_10600 [Pseudorhodobacter turbinis]|uniref:Lipoprotein n=2 Tax=Pseudorhodobacter turbinis TaxID=2500533 RepID=A0A4P8EH36_9RHOB|nr:hypothetical protein EOK75_10600 [Pseudorhodobacter turbinis]